MNNNLLLETSGDHYWYDLDYTENETKSNNHSNKSDNLNKSANLNKGDNLDKSTNLDKSVNLDKSTNLNKGGNLDKSDNSINLKKKNYQDYNKYNILKVNNSNMYNILYPSIKINPNLFVTNKNKIQQAGENIDKSNVDNKLIKKVEENINKSNNDNKLIQQAEENIEKSTDDNKLIQQAGENIEKSTDDNIKNLIQSKKDNNNLSKIDNIIKSKNYKKYIKYKNKFKIINNHLKEYYNI